jgi:FxsC-like protein
MPPGNNPSIEAARPPYRFFFSYSWNNRGGPLERFFKKLAEGVRDLVGGSIEDVAFRDRVTMEAGTEWPAGLLDAVTTSQVLVYLLSTDYLRSDYCGKELQVFLERVEQFRTANPGSEGPVFIQPVIWLPVLTAALPERLGILQSEDEAYPREYADKGLMSIAQTRNKTAYNSFVETLARRIVEAGQGNRLPALTKYESLAVVPNAFQSEEPAGRRPDPPASESETAVRCVYVAPKQSEVEELTRRRVVANGKERALRTNTSSYSPSGGWYWQPYRPTVVEKIGSLVNRLVMAAELRYDEIKLEDFPVASLDGALRELQEAVDKDEIILLIVDAWSAYLRRYEEFLGKLDRIAPTNRTAILVPWNESDSDTQAFCEDLERQLRVLLKERYFGAQPLPSFKPRVTTVEDFRKLVPDLLGTIRVGIETARATRKIVESSRSTPQVSSSRDTPG